MIVRRAGWDKRRTHRWSAGVRATADPGRRGLSPGLARRSARLGWRERVESRTPSRDVARDIRETKVVRAGVLTKSREPFVHPNSRSFSDDTLGLFDHNP